MGAVVIDGPEHPLQHAATHHKQIGVLALLDQDVRLALTTSVVTGTETSGSAAVAYSTAARAMPFQSTSSTVATTPKGALAYDLRYAVEFPSQGCIGARLREATPNREHPEYRPPPRTWSLAVADHAVSLRGRNPHG
jgi:hypothetical protein